MQIISPPSVAMPKGHYSPATVHNGVVYVAGQLPIDPAGQVQLGTIEEQTALCMQNIANILLAAGSDLHHILKINIFISDIALWPRINTEYSKIMGHHRPARIVVPCNPLHYGSQIEIDCIATVSTQ